MTPKEVSTSKQDPVPGEVFGDLYLFPRQLSSWFRFPCSPMKRRGLAASLDLAVFRVDIRPCVRRIQGIHNRFEYPVPLLGRAMNGRDLGKRKCLSSSVFHHGSGRAYCGQGLFHQWAVKEVFHIQVARGGEFRLTVGVVEQERNE